MKKLLALILALLTIPALSFCGRPAQQPPSGTEPSASATETAGLTPSGSGEGSAGAAESSAAPAAVYPLLPEKPSADQARRIVLDYMEKLSSVVWKCPVTIDFSKEKSYTSTLIYRAGQTYVGMPYVSHHSGLRYFELNYLDAERNYTGPATYSSMPGVTCAVACYTSFRNVSFRTRGSGSSTITPAANAGMVRVGDYTCTSTVTSEVIAANSQQAIFEAYALLLPADVLATRNSSTGHARMVWTGPVVRRNPDGTVNGERSYVSVIEQTSKFNEKTEYNTTWRVGQVYTFSALYKGDYIPCRLAEFDSGLDDLSVSVSGLPTAETIGGKKISGNVSSNFCILSSLLTVTDSGGRVVSESEQAKDYANDTVSFRINFAEKEMSTDLSALPAGTYRFRASVFVGYGECVLAEFDFKVG
jgi:hypothetical protein